MPTTVRIALLAGLLALLSNLAVIGFIYWRTHDEAVSTVRRQVIEQGKVLADVYRTGGKAALDDAIDDTMTYGDPQTAVALFDARRARDHGQSRRDSALGARLARRLSQRRSSGCAARPPRARPRSSPIGCRAASGWSAAASSARAWRFAKRSNARC